jgi:hypothetical protein
MVRRSLWVALALSLLALHHRGRLQAWARDVKTSSNVGKPAPEIPSAIASVDGRSLRMSSLRGRVVLLHFWTFD